MARDLSLSPLTLLPAQPLDIIDAAAFAGFSSVGLRLIPTIATDVDVLADRDLCRAIEKRIARGDIGVFDIEVVRLAADVDLDKARELIKFSAGIGAKVLTVTGVPLQKPDDRAGDDVVPILRGLSEICAQHGMDVALEFMLFRSVTTLAHALELREKADHPACKLTVDALHFHRAGGVAQDLAAMPQGAWGAFQLCDGPAVAPAELAQESRGARLLPGEGAIDLSGFLKAVPAGIPIALEVPRMGAAALSARENAAQCATAGQAALAKAGLA